MYRVIKHFTDLQDGGFAYNVGDLFPRKGFEASAERIEELASHSNRQRTPLIEKVKEEKVEKKKGAKK